MHASQGVETRADEQNILFIEDEAINVGQTDGATRSQVDEVGDGAENSIQPVRWSDDDKFLAWAAPVGTGGEASTNYADGFNAVTFSLDHYNSTFSSADFVATLSKPMVAQNTFDGSMYQAYGYTEEQIETEMEKNQGKLSEIYYSAIQSAESTIKEAKSQIASIDAQLAAIGSGQAEYSVRAVSNGVLHLLADYKAGMVVQTGSAVATITPENAEIVIDAYVSTADMARMEEGNEVQMAVDGLIQSVYGNITGTVEQIDSNLTSMEGENGQSNSVFKISSITPC